MASADELRQAIATNRQKLSDAISGASGKWEVGSEDAWGARKIAEHCISSEAAFAGMAAGAMQGKAPEGGELSLATVADAASALETAAAAADKVYRYVEDGDLAKAAPMPVRQEHRGRPAARCVSHWRPRQPNR